MKGTLAAVAAEPVESPRGRRVRARAARARARRRGSRARAWSRAESDAYAHLVEARKSEDGNVVEGARRAWSEMRGRAPSGLWAGGHPPARPRAEFEA